MAVQFNLLPDIKLEYNRQQRTKKFVYLVSGIAIAVSVGLLIISFTSVNILQKKLLNDANKDISSYSSKLKNIPDLDKVLTIQNQLNSLPSLHQKKHIASRLFDYLPQVTPTSVHVGKLSMDTTANTMEFSGTADTVESVNKFVDTLKFTSYQTGQNKDSDQSQKKAFTSVVLTKVDRNDKGASYTIDASYDPALFDSSLAITLTVPQETTTRSVINSPDANTSLFNGQTGTKSNEQGPQ